MSKQEGFPSQVVSRWAEIKRQDAQEKQGKKKPRPLSYEHAVPWLKEIEREKVRSYRKKRKKRGKKSRPVRENRIMVASEIEDARKRSRAAAYVPIHLKDEAGED